MQLREINNNYEKEINNLNKQLLELREKNIDENKSQLNKIEPLYNNQDEKQKDNTEKSFYINFISHTNDIVFSIPCKKDDLVAPLEHELCKKYPYLLEFKLYLIFNGNIVKRFQTLEENGIKNGDTIIFKIPDRYR